MSAVPGPEQHQELFTVISEKTGERRLDRFRDPVVAERRRQAMVDAGFAAVVVPPKKDERKAA